MVIHTKAKDFYDHLQYMYGQDKNIFWDRDVITRDKDKLYVGNFVNSSIFQANVKLDKFGLADYKISAPGAIYQLGILIISILGKVFLTYKGELVNEKLFDELLEKSGQHSKFIFGWPPKTQWEAVSEFVNGVNKNILKIHKHLNAPIISFWLDYHGYVSVNNAVPIISEIPGFVKILGQPERFYQQIYNFFIENRENVDLEPPVSVDEKSKIQKAGFDLKTSFRHPIK